MNAIAAILAAALGLAVVVLFVIYVLAPILNLLGKLIARVCRFVCGVISDLLRIVGAVITSVVLIPMVLGSVVIGRFSAAGHYVGAIRDEIGSIGYAVYRIAVGRPVWLFGLGALTEGIEQRIPEVVARAPGADRPSRRAGAFEGYTIVGSLPPGGSGAKLYIAKPDAAKQAAFAAIGRHGVDRVMIKSFSLSEGSSLPQIVRESRALEAAKNMGLVLEHELNDQRFFYVMPFVPGEDLTKVTRRLHEASGEKGLDRPRLVEGVGYVADLVETLSRYHSGGLWHKDVKPDNIIVHDGRAHLVDLGLVTPLRSAMTLTTHGTEYFRDPELVRMALRGVKVHQVRGEKFDIYAAGAVLYSVIENSFPAHGGLSQITRRCPEALRWIVRRAMAEYDKRYESSDLMLRDLRTVLEADDPFAVKPAELPSMGEGGAPEGLVAETPADAHEPAVAAVAAAGSPTPPRAEPAPEPAPVWREPVEPERVRPAIRLRNWWTGGYAVDPGAARGAGATAPMARAPHPVMASSGRAPAHEQLRRARQRVRTRRAAAANRMSRRRTRHGGEPSRALGAVLTMFIVVGGVMLVGGMIVSGLVKEDRRADRGESVVVESERASVEAPVAPETPGPFQMEAGPDGWRMSFDLEDVDPKTLERLASEWPEQAATWRAMFQEKIVPAIIEAQREAAIEAGVESDAVVFAPPLGRWLVVNDLGAGAGEDARKQALRTVKRLAAGGVEVVGLDGEEESLELVSGAKAAIGVGTPSDPETASRLRGWLERSEADLRGAIWVVHEDRPRYYIVPGENVDAAPVKRLIDRARR